MTSKIILFRVQAGDGRGPWRPGLSRHWIEPIGRELQADIFTAFGRHWLGDVPFGWHAGCACRSIQQLFAWFEPVEMRRLVILGYKPVSLLVDLIIRENEHQVVFARRLPLTVGAQVLEWPEGLPPPWREQSGERIA